MRNSLIAFLLATLLAPPALKAQTPEQTYFEWTTMPFAKEELAQRRDRLIDALKNHGKTGTVIVPSRDGFSYGETFRQLDDFYYLTGLELPNSLLVIDVADRSSIVFVPDKDLRFESGTRVNDFPGRRLLSDTSIAIRSGLTMKGMDAFTQLMNKKSAARQVVFVDSGRPGPVNVASDDYVTTYSPVQVLLEALGTRHLGLKFENMYDEMAQVRMIKSPAEIELLRKATAITVEGIRAAARAIKPGVDERFLEGVLEGSFKAQGAARLAFGSIIKSGPNSLWPWRILATHYDRRNRQLKSGELVIFDVGCEYQYYVSDVGRTFPVSGKFSDKQRRILNMEVAIADQIIDFIKPGITFSDIKHLTDSIIPPEAKPYMQVGLHFGHHLGLSTGDPSLQDARLEPGMVFTVEPWYYNHDDELAVFTEDVILVTSTGVEMLSKGLPRTAEEIEKSFEF